MFHDVFQGGKVMKTSYIIFFLFSLAQWLIAWKATNSDTLFNVLIISMIATNICFIVLFWTGIRRGAGL
jgi:uncharacterized membrane protein YfbV (UPF0208 family)